MSVLDTLHETSLDVKVKTGIFFILLIIAFIFTSMFTSPNDIGYAQKTGISKPSSTVLFADYFNRNPTNGLLNWEFSDSKINSLNEFRNPMSDYNLENRGYFLTKKDVDLYTAQGASKTRISDYTLDTDIQLVPAATEYACYLVFRAKNKDNCYEFGITSSSGIMRLAFYKKVAGVRKQIGAAANGWLKSTGKDTVHLIIRGNTFIAVVDDMTALIATDEENTFSSPGRIGAENDNLVYYDNIKVNRISSKQWVIKGRVTDQNSQPVSCMSMMLWRETPVEDGLAGMMSNNLNEGITADDGSYAIVVDQQVAGYFYLHVLEKYDDFDARFNPSAQKYSEKIINKIALTPKKSEQVINMTIAGTGTLAGKVVDEKKSPVKGAVISVASNNLPAGYAKTTTDANGNFSITSLNAQFNYSLAVSGSGFQKYTVNKAYMVNPSATTSIGTIVLRRPTVADNGIQNKKIPSIAINSSKSYTNNPVVKINIKSAGYKLMRFSATKGYTWTSWDKTSPTKTIKLPRGDGKKEVLAQFTNRPTVVGATCNSSIILDTKAPTVKIVYPTEHMVAKGKMKIEAQAADSFSGISKVIFYHDNDELIQEVDKAPYEILWNTDDVINGPVYIHAEAIDNAGNKTESTIINVDIENFLNIKPAQAIKSFQLIGPYKNTESSTRLSEDYVDGENMIRPTIDSDGKGYPSNSLIAKSENGVFDLKNYFTDIGQSTSYANTYVYAPTSYTATLSLAYVGGIQAWFNGEVVFEDTDLKSTDLKKKNATIYIESQWNQLMIKTAANDSGNCSFAAKISSEGDDFQVLKYKLDNPFPVILFEENFNQKAGALSDRWESSKTRFEDEMLLCEDYLITSKNIDEYAASMPGIANAVDYLLDANVLAYPTENEKAAYLIFRAKDKDNGYEFGITGNGSYTNFAFFNKTGGKRTQIGPSCSINSLRESLWDSSEGFHVQIAVRGNTFSAFIDNMDILTVTDTSTAYASPGKIGVENENIVYYDNITVKPAGPKPWIVKGRVVDQNSKPIPGIEIATYADPLSKEAEQDCQEYYTRTASDGSFCLIFKPTTPIDIGLETIQTDLMDATDDYIASKRVYSDAYVSGIRLSESTPEKNLDIKLLPTGSITGRIVDAKGRPIKNAYVTGGSLSFPNNWSIVKSDNNGVFVVPGISAPDNKFYIRIAAKDFSMKKLRTPYTISPGQTTKIADIVLDPAARITGRVVNSKGKPVANITVSSGAPGAHPWNDEGDDSIRSAKTNSKGVYLIENISAPGEYSVMVSKDYDILADKTVKVKPGQLITGINFKIK